MKEFITEEYYRASIEPVVYAAEQMDSMIHFRTGMRKELLADRAQLYGMEPFALDHLKRAGGRPLQALRVAAGGMWPPYTPMMTTASRRMDSHWAQLGDTVTMRYVEEYEYYNPDTGEVYRRGENVPEGAATMRPVP